MFPGKLLKRKRPNPFRGEAPLQQATEVAKPFGVKLAFPKRDRLIAVEQIWLTVQSLLLSARGWGTAQQYLLVSMHLFQTASSHVHQTRRTEIIRSTPVEPISRLGKTMARSSSNGHQLLVRLASRSRVLSAFFFIVLRTLVSLICSWASASLLAARWSRPSGLGITGSTLLGAARVRPSTAWSSRPGQLLP